MKNSFLIKALSLVLICSVGSTWTMGESGSGNGNGGSKKKDDVSLTKMLLIIGGSGAVVAAAQTLPESKIISQVSSALNVDRGLVKIGFGISGISGLLSLGANESWKKSLRTIAFRAWSIPFIWGLSSHPFVNKSLANIPALGDCLKANSLAQPGLNAFAFLGLYRITKNAGLKPLQAAFEHLGNATK